ncbi:MAG: hypothetical protein H0X36_06330 [Sphingomonadaceae bacterium]|nr:hypothetical protein [Sphingomonadaceae bacterium]
MRRFLAIAVLTAALPAPAQAESAVSHIVVYGRDACPKGGKDEIVVCAREPESERYRIPKRFRDAPKQDAASQSWTNRVATLEDAARIGRPNSCSAVGSFGQSGCTAAMLRAWFEERRQARSDAAQIP